MSQDLRGVNLSAGFVVKFGAAKFAAAVIVYTIFAIYLCQPHFRHFKKLEYLIPFNIFIASTGSFVLSRRWVSGFCASFFSGLMYGFSPFILGLTSFHPVAGFLASAIPWLFCPAAFAHKVAWRQLGTLLSVIPFLAIIFFFQLLVKYHLYILPIQAGLHIKDLAGLVLPLVASSQSVFPVGFYHVPIAALLLGFSMLFTARRFGIVVIFFISLVLVFCKPFFAVSPIIWLTIPVLCCSILIGAGIQGLASAGYADRKWVLVTAVLMLIFAVIALLLATKFTGFFAGFGMKYAKLLVLSAKMYILATVTAGIIFFIASARLRIHWLRLVILCLSMAVDIFFGAGFVVDKIF